MFSMERRLSKQVMVGQVAIGGGAPITVQSMLNVPAHDIAGNVAQALRLQACGCDIIRTAVPDKEAVRLVDALKNAVSIPVVADIHFDYLLAIAAMEHGADKIRINPGNIGGKNRVKAVVDVAKERNIPFESVTKFGKGSIIKYGKTKGDN